MTKLPFLLLVASSLLSAASALAADNVEQQKLSLLYQLNIDGCPVLARGHPATSKAFEAGKLRLTLDPLMCVDVANLTAAAPRYDPIAKQAYISIPVRLADAAVRDSVKMKLRRYLKSSASDVDFATVTRVEASAEPGSVFAALGFVWSQGQSVGSLRLGCRSVGPVGPACQVDRLLENLRRSKFAALDRVLLTVTLQSDDGAAASMDYRLTVVTIPAGLNSSTPLDYSMSSRDATSRGLPACSRQQLQRVRLIRLGSCTAYVYRRPGTKSTYLVEQPICYSSSDAIELSTEPDYSRGQYSLKLPLQLIRKPKDGGEKGSTLAEAWTQLRDLEPLSVQLMPVWRAQHVDSTVLSGRYEIGPLVAPSGGSGGMGEVRLHCKHVASCRYLRSQIGANPLDFWRHIEWRVTYLMPSADAVTASSGVDGSGGVCAHTPAAGRYSIRMEDGGTGAAAPATAVEAAEAAPRALEAAAWREVCPPNVGAHCQYLVLPSDGRHFVVVQQRRAGTERFDRPWADYVAGFGDSTDFWIGLTALHLLTSHGGATLRLELSQWNGTSFVSEYAGFQVGDASTNYRMTYRERTRTNVEFDAMATHKGMPFTTYDRDHDNDDGSCSLTWGRGGWWFNKCYKLYVNGLFPTTNLKEWKYNMWASDTEVVSLRHTRMMLLV